MKYLSDAFKTNHNTKLSELSLKFNFMGREGAHSLSEALAKPSLPQLRVLELDDNELCKEGLDEIQNTLRQNCCPVLANISLKYNYEKYSTFNS